MHAHRHHSQPRNSRPTRPLTAALIVGATYMVVEAAGGWWAGSLALISDAGHMLSDAFALGLSLAAMWIARAPPNSRKSYGYYRAEILAAMVNGATLIGVSVYVVVEAVRRFAHPAPIASTTMLGIAIGGIIVNLLMLAFLHNSRTTDNLNVRAAWLHVLSDTAGSVAVVGAGILVAAFDWTWADPVASLVIAVLIVRSAWALLAETLAILMESVPAGINLEQVRATLLAHPAVAEVHDLHVWSITAGFVALSAHVRVHAGPSSGLHQELGELLHRQFQIEHTTLQVEADAMDCHGGACD